MPQQGDIFPHRYFRVADSQGGGFRSLHNRSYRVLKLNLNIYRKRFGVGGERPYPHMDLVDPDFGYVDIARGYGIEAQRVTKPGDLAAALKTAIDSGKPYLLDVIIDGTV